MSKDHEILPGATSGSVTNRNCSDLILESSGSRKKKENHLITLKIQKTDNAAFSRAFTYLVETDKS